MNKKKTKKLFWSLFGIIASLIMLFPLVWMALAGFKPETEVLSVPFKFLPSRFILDNYIKVFEDGAFIRAIGTTLIGAVLSTAGCLTVNSLAAYVFARLEFPLKKLLWVICISTMFIPGIAVLIPSFIVVQKLGMLNTFAVLILPGLAQASWIFFLRQFYLGYPRSLEEAAMIDGAGRIRIFIHLYLPYSRAPFVIVGIGAFLGYWNAFVWPVMTLSDERLFQIMQVLAFFRSGQLANPAVVMAASAIAALPPLILFSIFQKHIIEGVKISGLK